MQDKKGIKLFQNKKIRAKWDEKEENFFNKNKLITPSTFHPASHYLLKLSSH